jgi:hypothetical protein
MIRCAAVILMLFCANAFAEIYRCDRNGKLEFSDRACAAGQIAIDVAEPNVMETSSGERALAQAFDDRTASLRAMRAAEKARTRAPALDAEPKTSKAKSKARKRSAAKRAKSIRQPATERPPEKLKTFKPRR